MARTLLLTMLLLVAVPATTGPLATATYHDPLTRIADMPVAGCCGHGAPVGGSAYFVFDRDVWRFDRAGEAWTQVATLPEPRRHAALVATASAVWVLAGYEPFTGGKVTTRETLRVDLASGAVTRHADQPFQGGAAATPNGRFVVAGATVYSFDPATGATTALPGSLPEGGGAVSAFTHGGRVYVLSHGSDRIVWHDETTNATGYASARLPWILTDAGLAWSGSAAYLFGGEVIEKPRDNRAFIHRSGGIVRFDPAADAVTVMAAAYPDPDVRWAVSAVWLGDRAFAFGGLKESFVFQGGFLVPVRVIQSDAYRYDPTHDGPNAPPVSLVAAFPPQVECGTVTFDGTGSDDPDGDALHYFWYMWEDGWGGGWSRMAAEDSAIVLRDFQPGDYGIELRATDRKEAAFHNQTLRVRDTTPPSGTPLVWDANGVPVGGNGAVVVGDARAGVVVSESCDMQYVDFTIDGQLTRDFTEPYQVFVQDPPRGFQRTVTVNAVVKDEADNQVTLTYSFVHVGA